MGLTVIDLDIKNLPLEDFMKALGQEPVAADGNLRIYNAPYDDEHKPTMVVNIETNLWRDTKSGAYGGIYDLAYELTGSCNRSELNFYIAGEIAPALAKQEMSALQKITLRHEPDLHGRSSILPPMPKQEEAKPKRRFKLF